MQTFTTVGGTVLTLKPVTAFFMLQIAMKVEKEWRDKGEAIDAPTYTLKLAAGDEETFPHEENTLEVEGDPEQTKVNKLRWAKHLDALQRFQQAQQEAVHDALLRECVEWEGEGQGGWEKKYARHGITIPEDRRFFYLKHELLTTSDYVKLCAELRLLAAGREVSQELIDSMDRLFRGAVGGAERKALEQLSNIIWPVVGTSEIQPSTDGESLGPDAGSVGSRIGSQ